MVQTSLKFNEIFLLAPKNSRRNKWIHNFILGSRTRNWNILNFMEVIKKLEMLKPFVRHITHNQGTILIVLVNKYKFLHKYFYFINTYLPLYDKIIFLDLWKLGTLSNYNHIRFINTRQLPSVIFLFNLKGTTPILAEALTLRIPVVSFVNVDVSFDQVSKYLYFPIPLSNSLSNIYFLVSFLKNIVLNYHKYAREFNLESYVFNTFISNYNKNRDIKVLKRLVKKFSWGLSIPQAGLIVSKFIKKNNIDFLSTNLENLEDDFIELNYTKKQYLTSRRFFYDRFLMLEFLKFRESIGYLNKVKKVHNYNFYLFDERYRITYLDLKILNQIKKNFFNFYKFWFRSIKYKKGSKLWKEMMANKNKKVIGKYEKEIIKFRKNRKNRHKENLEVRRKALERKAGKRAKIFLKEFF